MTETKQPSGRDGMKRAMTTDELIEMARAFDRVAQRIERRAYPFVRQLAYRYRQEARRVAGLEAEVDAGEYR